MREEEEIAIGSARVEQILELRHRVLRAGLPAETARFDGDERETTKHFGAWMQEGEGQTPGLVGCATILKSEWEGKPAWQLRGMAVDEKVRQRGIGRKLVEAAEKFTAASNVRRLWCNARVPAVGFYERMGWRVVSGVFEVPTAGPHVKMMREV